MLDKSQPHGTSLGPEKRSGEATVSRRGFLGLVGAAVIAGLGTAHAVNDLVQEQDDGEGGLFDREVDPMLETDTKVKWFIHEVLGIAETSLSTAQLDSPVQAPEGNGCDKVKFKHQVNKDGKQVGGEVYVSGWQNKVSVGVYVEDKNNPDLRRYLDAIFMTESPALRQSITEGKITFRELLAKLNDTQTTDVALYSLQCMETQRASFTGDSVLGVGPAADGYKTFRLVHSKDDYYELEESHCEYQGTPGFKNAVTKVFKRSGRVLDLIKSCM